MQAHKIIEEVVGLKKQGQIDPVVADLVMSKIEEAVKFDFCIDETPVFSGQGMIELFKNQQLPYPVCFFEVHEVGAILTRQLNNIRRIPIMVFLKIKGKWGVLPPEDMLFFDPDAMYIGTASQDEDVKKFYSDRFDEWANNPESTYSVICGLIGLIYRSLAVMNCSNVVCVDNPPDEKLNKKRIKASKVPLFSYKTLHIKTGDKERMAGGVTKHGDRVGPRLHLRRGHIRRLTPDKTTWVSSCVVGDEKKGIVMKNYRVTA